MYFDVDIYLDMCEMISRSTARSLELQVLNYCASRTFNAKVIIPHWRRVSANATIKLEDAAPLAAAAALAVLAAGSQLS